MWLKDIIKKLSTLHCPLKNEEETPDEEEQEEPEQETAPIIMNTKYTILIDNGHGIDTAGKRSPDGTIREYAYCRKVAGELTASLKAKGYDARFLVAEDCDIPLSERVRRVNAVCKEKGATNVILVSIHINAAGNGTQWMDASGWQACMSLNASVRSMTLGECLADAAAKYGLKVRKPKATQKVWEQNLCICRDTNCPAILTENLFMDNHADAEYLKTPEGLKTIVSLHLDGIVSYIENYG